MTKNEKGMFWLSLAFVLAAGSVVYYGIRDKKEDERERELEFAKD